MNPVVGGILVAAISAVSGFLGVWLTTRAQKTQARNDEAATVFGGFGVLVDDLRAERDVIRDELNHQAERHRRELETQRTKFANELATYLERLERASAELAACEARCEECRRGMAELLATLSTLRAVVVDEVIKAAADRAFETHAAGIDPDDLENADTASIRRFLGQISANPPDKET